MRAYKFGARNEHIPIPVSTSIIETKRYFFFKTVFIEREIDITCSCASVASNNASKESSSFQTTRCRKLDSTDGTTSGVGMFLGSWCIAHILEKYHWEDVRCTVKEIQVEKAVQYEPKRRMSITYIAPRNARKCTAVFACLQISGTTLQRYSKIT